MTHPKLSIIIPNYNHGHLLQDAVDSVAKREQPSVEIIIIDDASMDNSLEVIGGLRQKYSNIRLIEHKSNQGVNATAHEGTVLAKGGYVHYLAADDKRLPLFIEKTMFVLEKHPNIPICCSAAIVVNEDKTKLTHHFLSKEKRYYVFDPKTLSKIIRRSNFWIAGHTAIIKKKLLLKHGGYDANLGLFSDWYLFYKIALHGGLAYLPEGLSEWHLNSTSFAAKFNKEELRVIYRYLLGLFEKDRHTRKMFQKADILRPMVRSLFSELIQKPKYWKYLFPLISGSIEYRLEKYLGIKINDFLLKKILKKNQ